MDVLGYLFVAFLCLVFGAIGYAWWQKFVHDRPDRYGKGRGHDLRGPERGQWDRHDER
ncbi:hypothetical protein KUH32_08110 [Thalassococcus sp. CAU 1522]|uniref:Uncharacterized protein n=1 Tax=Thalassococcus arenae TaxID=2851652 RepID=A0ABS6N6T8_9RHOB|nr:hypothetical protein [Thalassococcus arenae]MBV2359735.1 hypothetical protein [Thalassococcus arenae]